MATPEQQSAYDSYRNATTKGTKQSTVPQSLRSDFVNFIQNFSPIDPFSIDVTHLGSVSFPEEMFYRFLLATTFHVHWGNYDPKAFGSGNHLTSSLRYHSGTYKITQNGFTEDSLVYSFNNPTVTLTSTSLTLSEGLVVVKYELTPSEVNGVQVMNYNLKVFGRVYANSYIVPFEI